MQSFTLHPHTKNGTLSVLRGTLLKISTPSHIRENTNITCEYLLISYQFLFFFLVRECRHSCHATTKYLFTVVCECEEAKKKKCLVGSLYWRRPSARHLKYGVGIWCERVELESVFWEKCDSFFFFFSPSFRFWWSHGQALLRKTGLCGYLWDDWYSANDIRPCITITTSHPATSCCTYIFKRLLNTRSFCLFALMQWINKVRIFTCFFVGPAGAMSRRNSLDEKVGGGSDSERIHKVKTWFVFFITADSFPSRIPS